MGDAFAVVEKMIRKNLFLRPFFGKLESLSPIVGTLSTIPFKKYDLGLLNTMISTNNKYLSLKRAITELIQAVKGGGAFFNANHILEIRVKWCDGKKSQGDANDAKLKGLVSYLD